MFALAESVLSSAKLWIEEDSIKKKTSLIEKSNRSGPTLFIKGAWLPLITFLFKGACLSIVPKTFSVMDL